MKIYPKILLTALFTIFVLILPKSVEAYQVKSYLLVPSDKNLTPEKIRQYKTDMLKALKNIQNFYKLNIGKTFKIVDDLEIINAEKSAGDILEKPAASVDGVLYNTRGISNVGVFFWFLDGYKLLPEHPGLIRLVGIIGSRDLIDAGWHSTNGISGDERRITGYAYLSQNTLENLHRYDDTIRDYAERTVAHELGHAFGLVNGPYARWHSCTVVSTHECKPSAPKPYPSEDENNYSIMGYGSAGFYPWRGYTNVGFNNSLHNPEIKRLYETKFINPEGDAVPKSLSSEEIKKQRETSALSFCHQFDKKVSDCDKNRPRCSYSFCSEQCWPNTTPPDTVCKSAPASSGNSRIQSIKTSLRCGAENKPLPNVKVNLFSPGANNSFANSQTDANGISVLSFDANKLVGVDVQADSVAGVKSQSDRYPVVPGYSLKDQDGAYRIGIHYDSCPGETITVNFSLTCGKNQTPLPITVVSIAKVSTKGQDIIAQATTNETGSGSLTLPPPNLKPAEYLELKPEQKTKDNTPTPSSFVLQKGSGGYAKEYSFSSRYPKCPPDLTNQQNIDIGTTITTPQGETPKLEQVIISDENSQPQVIDNPEEQQEVIVDLATNNPVSIDEVYSDGTVKEYEASLEDGDITKIANVEVIAKVVKKINKAEVNGKSVDFADPENVLVDIELPDQPSEDGAYRIPIVVCFNNSEDDCIRTAYVFHLNQPEQENPAAPNPCPDDEFCEEGTITEKYGGVYDGEKCVYNFRRTERTCQ